MSIELTICGTASASNEFLRPIRSAIQPTKIVPIKPPIPKTEPIHAISFILNRPVGNGQSSESYIRNELAVHPTDIEYPSVHKFTKKRNTK